MRIDAESDPIRVDIWPSEAVPSPRTLRTTKHVIWWEKEDGKDLFAASPALRCLAHIRSSESYGIEELDEVTRKKALVEKAFAFYLDEDGRQWT